MLDRSVYRDAFRQDVAGVADAARDAMEAPIPTCPGWTVATLVTHLTGIYASRIRLVREGARDNIIRDYGDLGLPLAYADWFTVEFDPGPDDPHPVAMPGGLLNLFEQQAAELETVLYAAAPQKSVWTWWPPDQTAGFWQRRMAHETAVHRWDAQVAVGEPRPIMAVLARDGIDEVLDVMAPRARQSARHARPGRGETYHFHCTDGPGEWTVRFDGADVTVTRAHARAEVAVRGTASDLLLFLWHRVAPDALDVVGDAALLDRYVELAPPG